MTYFPSRRWLAIELALVFILLPAAISIMRAHGWIVPLIWSIAALCWRVLHNRGVVWKEEWNIGAVTKDNMRPIVLRFIPNAIATSVFTWVILPHGMLFHMLLSNTTGWCLVMLLYPILSVIPQEIIFRSFFLSRYAPLIPEKYMRISNAIIFGWVHIIMKNWIAMLFSAIGGWMFVDTYRRHRSMALAAVEHSMYGCFIFTIGLGVYFYHGNVH